MQFTFIRSKCYKVIVSHFHSIYKIYYLHKMDVWELNVQCTFSMNDDRFWWCVCECLIYFECIIVMAQIHTMLFLALLLSLAFSNDNLESSLYKVFGIDKKIVIIIEIMTCNNNLTLKRNHDHLAARPGWYWWNCVERFRGSNPVDDLGYCDYVDVVELAHSSQKLQQSLQVTVVSAIAKFNKYIFVNLIKMFSV